MFLLYTNPYLSLTAISQHKIWNTFLWQYITTPSRHEHNSFTHKLSVNHHKCTHLNGLSKFCVSKENFKNIKSLFCKMKINNLKCSQMTVETVHTDVSHTLYVCCKTAIICRLTYFVFVHQRLFNPLCY